MKRKDIKAGVVYAIKSAYGSPSPVVFLEDAAATVFESQRAASARYRALADHYKAAPGRGFSTPSRGYAAVVASPGMAARDEVLAAMQALDVAAELARFRGDQAGCRPASAALTFQIITSLSSIPGTYDTVTAEYEAQKAAERKRDDEIRDRRNADRKRVDDVREALSVIAGIDSRYVCEDYGKHGIFIAIDDAERLLSLLRDRQP